MHLCVYEREREKDRDRDRALCFSERKNKMSYFFLIVYSSPKEKEVINVEMLCCYCCKNN